jgi:phosphatidylglycerophosphate synthase
MSSSESLSYGDIVRRLSAAQKSNRGAAGYSRWVNRRVGRRFAAAAYLAGLTPNQVSLISAAFTYSAIALVATVKPAWWQAALIVALLLIGYALDSADGQLARLRGSGSPAGEWLDHALDAVKNVGFHAAILICWFRWYDFGSDAWLLVPLGFAIVSTVFFFTMTLADMLRRIARVRAGGSAKTTAAVNPDEKAPVLRSLIVLPNDYGVHCVVMILLPLQTAFVGVYTFLAVCNAAFLAAGWVRWFREMKTLADPVVAGA